MTKAQAFATPETKAAPVEVKTKTLFKEDFSKTTVNKTVVFGIMILTTFMRGIKIGTCIKIT